MSKAAKKPAESSGSPAWMATFADLMSLLMCFFVLLLSFSEMDLQKYKQVSGSMKNAFGVQRSIKTMETPKGTSIIAREFSPGRPSPTILKVIRQDSIDQTKQTLDFTDVKSDPKDGQNVYEEGMGKGQYTKKQNEDGNDTQQFVNNIGVDKDKAKAVEESFEQAIEESKIKGEMPEEETLADAKKLLEAMSEEVKKGIVEIETEGKKILVRIREKGSFPSGSATFKDDFLPVLAKLRDSLTTIHGKVLIAGHTDNIPIRTSRFRSNWELSSSRAVSVVHELLKTDELNPKRFLIEGHGEAHPLVPNDTRENRALNRRVELTIVQGNNPEDESEEKSAENIITRALKNELKLPKNVMPEVITEQDPFAGQKPENPQEKADDSSEVKPHALISVETLIMNAEPTDSTAQETGAKNAISEVPVEEPAPAMNQQQPKMNDIEARIKSFSDKMRRHRR